MYFTDTQQKCWDILCNEDGETVARLLTDYHGNCLLDDGFLEFLEKEYLSPEDLEYWSLWWLHSQSL